MANRGRPKKEDFKDDNYEDDSQNYSQEEPEPTNEQMAQTIPEPTNEQMAQTIPESDYEENIYKSDSNIVGNGTHPDFNPFAESVVERDYATPQIASGVVDDIHEPQFIPPSYEDIVNENQNRATLEEDSPFDNPNPALNDLSPKDKKLACESLVDTVLDGYEQLHRYAQYIVKVDEDELLQKHQAGKINLRDRIPVDENGNEMSVSEFISQYNQQCVEALQYDKEFGHTVRPAMIRVFMKKGWGMSDEQFLLYHFGKDIAIKAGLVFQLKKMIKTTLEELEKSHKKTKNNQRPPQQQQQRPPQQQFEPEEEYDDLDDDLDDLDDLDDNYEETQLSPLTPEEDFEDNTQIYNQNLIVNMPENKPPTILPKEIK